MFDNLSNKESDFYNSKLFNQHFSYANDDSNNSDDFARDFDSNEEDLNGPNIRVLELSNSDSETASIISRESRDLNTS